MHTIKVGVKKEIAWNTRTLYYYDCTVCIYVLCRIVIVEKYICQLTMFTMDWILFPYVCFWGLPVWAPGSLSHYLYYIPKSSHLFFNYYKLSSSFFHFWFWLFWGEFSLVGINKVISSVWKEEELTEGEKWK